VFLATPGTRAFSGMAATSSPVIPQLMPAAATSSPVALSPEGIFFGAKERAQGLLDDRDGGDGTEGADSVDNLRAVDAVNRAREEETKKILIQGMNYIGSAPEEVLANVKPLFDLYIPNRQNSNVPKLIADSVIAEGTQEILANLVRRLEGTVSERNKWGRERYAKWLSTAEAALGVFKAAQQQVAASSPALVAIDEPVTLKHDKPVGAAAFSPDGTIAIGEGRAVKLFDSDYNPLDVSLSHPNTVKAIAFSPDGTKMAVGSYNEVYIYKRDGNTHEPNPIVLRYSGWANYVSFSSDSRRIIVSGENTASLWDVDGGHIGTQSMDASGKWVKGSAFSPNGEKLAIALAFGKAYSDKIVVLNTNDNSVVGNVEGSGDAIYSVAFSPDSGKMISAEASGVHIWNLDTSAIIEVQNLGYPDTFYSAAFSPNGEIIAAAGDQTGIKIWDIEGRSITTLGYGLTFSSVAFSPDGTKIFGVSVDKRGDPMVWDISGLQKSSSPVTTIEEVGVWVKGENMGNGILTVDVTFKPPQREALAGWLSRGLGYIVINGRSLSQIESIVFHALPSSDTDRKSFNLAESVVFGQLPDGEEIGRIDFSENPLPDIAQIRPEQLSSSASSPAEVLGHGEIKFTEPTRKDLYLIFSKLRELVRPGTSSDNPSRDLVDKFNDLEEYFVYVKDQQATEAATVNIADLVNNTSLAPVIFWAIPKLTIMMKQVQSKPESHDPKPKSVDEVLAILTTVDRINSKRLPVELHEPKEASSPATTEAGRALGGIDFRTIPMLIQPMGGFSNLKFILPKLANLEAINLNQELASIQQLIQAGIIPSGERLKAYVSACYQKQAMKSQLDALIPSLVEICKLEEQRCEKAEPALLETLVLVDATP
jgi:WD40 repeat protein